jgi:hypothetical protein
LCVTDSEAAAEYCDPDKLEKIRASVFTNPARKRDPDAKKYRMVATIYYNLCFSKRGVWYNRDARAKLQAAYNSKP